MNSLGMDLSNYSVEDVQQANRRAGRGEATLAKSLFWAGHDLAWNRLLGRDPHGRLPRLSSGGGPIAHRLHGYFNGQRPDELPLRAG